MRILNNRTRWKTSQLAKLIRRVAQDEMSPTFYLSATTKAQRENQLRVGMGAPPRPYYRISVVPPVVPRRTIVTSSAVAKRPKFTLFVPEVPVPTGFTLRELACTIAQCMAINRGYDKRDLRQVAKYWENDLPAFAWADDFRLELRKPREKRDAPPPTKVQKLARRLLVAERNVDHWQAKGAMADKRVRLWSGHVRRLTTQLARAKAKEEAAKTQAAPNETIVTFQV